MDVAEKLKDLRDALWQASIETSSGTPEGSSDPYSQPLEQLVETLRKNGSISADDAAFVTSFLDRYEEIPAGRSDPSVEDASDTRLSGIIAALRSLRLTSVQDPEGRGKEG